MRQALTEAQIAQFRARTCAAAEGLFAAHGLDGVSMRSIAESLGCSQTALYRYFSDKEEILAAVRTSAFLRFAAALEAAQTGQDAREDARAIGKAYLQFAQDEPDAYSLMFDLRQPDPSRYPELVAAIRRTKACAAPYVRTMIAEGIISGDAEELGHFFWAAAHGLVSLHAKGFMGFGGALTELHAAMMRLLLRGMATRPR
jgi:AcrR family transcriptional regulator